MGVAVERKGPFGNNYTFLKVCAECVTSLITKESSDNITMINICVETSPITPLEISY